MLYKSSQHGAVFYLRADEELFIEHVDPSASEKCDPRRCVDVLAYSLLMRLLVIQSRV